MHRGWLVYNREDYEKNRPFADRFAQGCSGHGLAIELVFREDIGLTLAEGRLGTCPPQAFLPAFVINRTRDHLLGRFFEQAGCRVFNRAEVTRVCNDKIETHLLALSLGLPQAATAFCVNTPDGVLRHGLAYPVVVKDPRGHGGGQVRLASCEAELVALASGMGCGRVVVQALCAGPGVDVRAYVLGGRVLCAVLRRSSGDFRANLSLGGRAEPFELDRNQLDMAARLMSALRPDFAGIDFILDEGGRWLFNEMEDAVGSRALYELGLLDAADAYMAWIREALSS